MKSSIFPLILILLFNSCSMKEDPPVILPDIQLDLTPPRLMETDASQGETVYFYFNEPLCLAEETATLDSGDTATLTITGENCLTLKPDSQLDPGKVYQTSLSVEDYAGNSNNFLIRFWGWNPALPEALINELNPKGSGNNTDTLEIFFTKGGSTAGMTLYYGTAAHHEYKYVLPKLEVENGDYLLIHCRPEGIREEINEENEKDASGGILSHDEAWDLWLPEDSGLSGNNGVITLYSSPEGNLMDCIIYSDREADPEDELLGWTSATFDAVSDLFDSGDWKFNNTNIAPEEAVRSCYTTGTRTLSRSSLSEDTDSAADWHTTPTGGKSFGEANTDEVYAPQ